MTEVNATDAQIKEARSLLWEMGCLEWKLSPTQRKIYDFFHGKTDKAIVVNAARRLGKSYVLVIMAFEQCLKYPNSIVKFLQPEVKMIRTNIRPIFDEIMLDCPFHLTPQFKTQDNIYYFPNGSQIQLAGTDNGNYMKLRGGNTHLGIIDEAGFCTDLHHIVDSILGPTTLLTKGRIILSSTTPPNPDHEFIKYMDTAEEEDRLIRKTIYDAMEDDKGSESPRITELIIADIIKSIAGGQNSDSFRTEFLCERIRNSKDSVVPEFTDDIIKDTVVEWYKPVFCDRYESMDVGVMDLTAILFAFYDFEHAKLVILDEASLVGHEVNSRNITKVIREKEQEHFFDKLTQEVLPVYKRISDNNLILLNDLRQPPYNLSFIATDKHNREPYINKMRLMIQDGRIIIHPRCKSLIQHLKNATWDKTRKEFKRSGEYGHYDFVAALAYLVRNLDENHNPYPAGYKYRKLSEQGAFFVKDRSEELDNNKYNRAFGTMFQSKSPMKRNK